MLLTSIRYRKVESKMVKNDMHANCFKELFWLSEDNKPKLWAKKPNLPKNSNPDKSMRFISSGK